MSLPLSLVHAGEPGIAIIYCRTIAKIDKIYRYMRNNVGDSMKNFIRPFHSDLTQKYRDETLRMLKASDGFKVIIATDTLGMVKYFMMAYLTTE
jgi:superfamily II DNA/RNA helicase